MKILRKTSLPDKRRDLTGYGATAARKGLLAWAAALGGHLADRVRSRSYDSERNDLALQSRLHARLLWARPQRRAGDCGGRSGEGGEGSKQRMRLYHFTLSLMTALMLTGCAGGMDGGAPDNYSDNLRLRRRGRDSRSHECEQIGTRKERHLLRRFGGHRLLRGDLHGAPRASCGKWKAHLDGSTSAKFVAEEDPPFPAGQKSG
jgi:hypothetical protein